MLFRSDGQGKRKGLGTFGISGVERDIGITCRRYAYHYIFRRLSRSKADIRKELQWFQDHGIRLKVLDLPTSLVEVPEGQEWIVEMINHILIEVLASMAEQERLLIKKRQREGIEAAQKKGKHLGRPRLQVPEEFPEVYARWRAGQISVKSAMKMLRMAKTSFYRLVNQYEGCAVPKGVE